ncbi:DAHL domain-containing protein [Massilia aquatica]|uniref:DAHL domain-containing protein n=1 Tax=Massilia aquatica TaxID=2609000 RepID=UPI001E3136F1|nr:DAHL domain-containing protein [Massilia aquatica]
MSAARRARLAWAPLAGVALVLAAALLFFQFKTRSVDLAAYAGDLSLLSQIKQLDAHWELSAMKSRIGLNQTYDPLVDPVPALRALPQQLRMLAARPEMGAAQRAASIAAYQRALQAKIGLVESFKSHNAVLHNSVAFLPQAARDIGSGGARQRRAAALAFEILLATLIHQQGGSAAPAAAIEEALLRLARMRPRLAPDSAHSIDLFAMHVRTVLREHALVGALLERIVRAPTAQRVDAIGAAVGAGQARAVQQLQQYRFYLLLFAAALVALLLYATLRLVLSHATIRRGNEALQHANDHLESRVKLRTAELAEAQQRLIEAARKAGMAEVATNVLHNVGNVLNSVCVSAGLVSQQLRHSRGAGLDQAVALIQAQGAGLGAFLEHDARGRCLPAYLASLAGAIGAERRTLLEELGSMVRWLEHVKEIVATQQSYAGASCLVELCRPAELIGEAIGMSAAALAHAQVALDTDFEELPAALLDRHRVLQILLNLLSNARQAMAAPPPPPQPGRVAIAVRLGAAGARALRIEVADHGTGIAAADLTRIFAHGFTTRKDGHGFGLHSCALAAREMGGRLSVHSAGPGCGATFTLVLPTDGQALPEEAST